MPGNQNDKKERQDFQKDFSNICAEWKFDRGLDKLILGACRTFKEIPKKQKR